MQTFISILVNGTQLATTLTVHGKIFGDHQKIRRRVAHRNEPPVKGGQNEAL